MFLRKSKFESIIRELEDLKRENKSCKSENASLKKVNEKLEKLLKEYESKENYYVNDEPCECCDCEEVLCYSDSSLGTKKYEEAFKRYSEEGADIHTLNSIGYDSSVYLDAIFDVIWALDTRTNTKTSVRKLIIDKFLTKDTKEFVNSEEFKSRMQPEKDFDDE